MAKIGLIDVDGHNFPNLALMKLSAYHKQIGDVVEWVIADNYDKTYMSKVFTFTPDHIKGISQYGEIIKGGSGYNFDKLLPKIDKLQPDYSIYKSLFNSKKWLKKYPPKVAIGFLTRGCNNKCSWCIVPQKEGKIKPYMDISEISNGYKHIVLLDNNILQSNYGLKQIEKIIELRLKIDFNQGLDARMIANNPYIAKLLAKVKWHKPLRMACDTKSQMPYIEKATKLLRKYGTKPQAYFIYVLVKNIEDALYRVEFLRKLRLDPFAQPYRDFTTNKEPTKELRRFARWVNHKAIFKTVEYKDYVQALK